MLPMQNPIKSLLCLIKQNFKQSENLQSSFVGVFAQIVSSTSFIVNILIIYIHKNYTKQLLYSLNHKISKQKNYHFRIDALNFNTHTTTIISLKIKNM